MPPAAKNMRLLLPAALWSEDSPLQHSVSCAASLPCQPDASGAGTKNFSAAQSESFATKLEASSSTQDRSVYESAGSSLWTGGEDGGIVVWKLEAQEEGNGGQAELRGSAHLPEDKGAPSQALPLRMAPVALLCGHHVGICALLPCSSTSTATGSSPKAGTTGSATSGGAVGGVLTWAAPAHHGRQDRAPAGVAAAGNQGKADVPGTYPGTAGTNLDAAQQEWRQQQQPGREADVSTSTGGEKLDRMLSLCWQGTMCVWDGRSRKCKRRRRLPAWIGVPVAAQPLPHDASLVCIAANEVSPSGMPGARSGGSTQSSRRGSALNSPRAELHRSPSGGSTHSSLAGRDRARSSADTPGRSSALEGAFSSPSSAASSSPSSPVPLRGAPGAAERTDGGPEGGLDSISRSGSAGSAAAATAAAAAAVRGAAAAAAAAASRFASPPELVKLSVVLVHAATLNLIQVIDQGSLLCSPVAGLRLVLDPYPPSPPGWNGASPRPGAPRIPPHHSVGEAWASDGGYTEGAPRAEPRSFSAVACTWAGEVRTWPAWQLQDQRQGTPQGLSHRTARVAPRHPQLVNGADAPPRSVPASVRSSLDEPNHLGASGSHSPDPASGAGGYLGASDSHTAPWPPKGGAAGDTEHEGKPGEREALPPRAGVPVSALPRAYTLPCLSGVKDMVASSNSNSTAALKSAASVVANGDSASDAWGAGRAPEMPVCVTVSPRGECALAVFPSRFVLVSMLGEELASAGPMAAPSGTPGIDRPAQAGGLRGTGTGTGAGAGGGELGLVDQEPAPADGMSFLCSMLAPLQGGLFLESTSATSGTPGATTATASASTGGSSGIGEASTSGEQAPCPPVRFLVWNEMGAALVYELRAQGGASSAGATTPAAAFSSGAEVSQSHYSTPVHPTPTQGGGPAPAPGSLKSLSLISVIPPAAAVSVPAWAASPMRRSASSSTLQPDTKAGSGMGGSRQRHHSESPGGTLEEDSGPSPLAFHFWQLHSTFSGPPAPKDSTVPTQESLLVARAKSTRWQKSPQPTTAPGANGGNRMTAGVDVWCCAVAPVHPRPAEAVGLGAGQEVGPTPGWGVSSGLGPGGPSGMSSPVQQRERKQVREEEAGHRSLLWWLPPPGRLWAAKGVGVATKEAQASLSDSWKSYGKAKKALPPHLPPPQPLPGSRSEPIGASSPYTAPRPGASVPAHGMSNTSHCGAHQSGISRARACEVSSLCLIGGGRGGLGPSLLMRARTCGDIEAVPLTELGDETEPSAPMQTPSSTATAASAIPSAKGSPSAHPEAAWLLRGHVGSVLCMAEHGRPCDSPSPYFHSGPQDPNHSQAPQQQGEGVTEEAGAAFAPAGGPDSGSGVPASSHSRYSVSPSVQVRSGAGGEHLSARLQRVLISGGADWSVRIWGLASLGHSGLHYGLDSSDTGATEEGSVGAGSARGTVLAESEAESGGHACGTPHAGPGLRALAVLRHHTGPVRQIVLPPSAAAAVSSHLLPTSGTPVPGAATGSPPALPPWLYCFLTLSDDGAVGVCSLRTLSCQRILPGHPGVPRDVLWDAARGYLAVLCRPHKPSPHSLLSATMGTPSTGELGKAYCAGAGARVSVPSSANPVSSLGSSTWSGAGGAGAGTGAGRRRMGKGRRAQVRRGYGPEQWVVEDAAYAEARGDGCCTGSADADTDNAGEAGGRAESKGYSTAREAVRSGGVEECTVSTGGTTGTKSWMSSIFDMVRIDSEDTPAPETETATSRGTAVADDSRSIGSTVRTDSRTSAAADDLAAQRQHERHRESESSGQLREREQQSSSASRKRDGSGSVPVTEAHRAGAGAGEGWPGAWERVRDFSAASPQDVLLVWDLHSGAKERMLRAAPAHSLLACFHARMRAPPQAFAAALPLSVTPQSSVPGAGSPSASPNLGPLGQGAARAVGAGQSVPFPLEELSLTRPRHTSVGNSASVDSSIAAVDDGVGPSQKAGVGIADSHSSTAPGQGPGPRRSEQSPGASQSDSGSQLGSIQGAEVHYPTEACYHMESPGTRPEAGAGAKESSTGAESGATLARRKLYIQFLDTQRRAQEAPVPESASVGAKKPELGGEGEERPDWDIRIEAEGSKGHSQGQWQGQVQVQNEGTGSEPLVYRVPAIRGQCVFPGTSALTVDVLALLSTHWGTPRDHQAFLLRQQQVLATLNSPRAALPTATVNPSATANVKLGAGVASSAGSAHVEAGKRGPGPGQEDGAGAAGSASSSRSTSPIISCSTGSSTSMRSGATGGTDDGVPDSELPIPEAHPDNLPKQRQQQLLILEQHEQQQLWLQQQEQQQAWHQQVFLKGPQAQAIRNGLRYLTAWGLEGAGEVDQEVRDTLGAPLPRGLLLGLGILGDKGALTLALPGPHAAAEMFHVSPEFSSLRSLALVAASHRLQQLLPLTTPSSPLPPSPCLRAPSPLPTTQEGKLYPADSTYPRPKSVVASCQRLAAFYSTQFAEGPLPAAPPSLEIYACFWQDAVQQVRAAARSLFHISAHRSFPPLLRRSAPAPFAPGAPLPALAASPSGPQPAPAGPVATATAVTAPPPGGARPGKSTLRSKVGAGPSRGVPGAVPVVADWGAWDQPDIISQWVEAEDGYELVSSVGGTVYDARSARTNVAAALAVWYGDQSRRDLASAVSPSVLSLVRAASSGHSATAAEILAEGMGATWQPLIGPQIPRLIADVFLLCEALQGSWAEASARSFAGGAITSSYSAGTPGVSPSTSISDPSASSASKKGKGQGQGQGATQGLTSPLGKTDTLDSTPSFGNRPTASAPRGSAEPPPTTAPAFNSPNASPGTSAPASRTGTPTASTEASLRALELGAAGTGTGSVPISPRPGPPGAASWLDGYATGYTTGPQGVEFGFGGGSNVPAAGVAVVVREALASVLLPALAVADMHAFLLAAQDLQTPSAAGAPSASASGGTAGAGSGRSSKGGSGGDSGGVASAGVSSGLGQQGLVSGGTSVHLTALMAAIRTVRSHPRAVLLHLPHLVDWAMRCIDPANATLRSCCIHTVMALLADLPRIFPMVAISGAAPGAPKASGAGAGAGTQGAGPAPSLLNSSGDIPAAYQLRMAVGEALNDVTRVCIHVYDLSSATKFRVLDAGLPAGHPAASSVVAPKVVSPTARRSDQAVSPSAGHNPVSPTTGVSRVPSSTSSSLSLGGISAVAFSPSGDALVAFSQLGMILRWWSLGVSWWERLMLTRSVAVHGPPLHCTRLVLVPQLPPLLPDLLGVVTQQLREKQQQQQQQQQGQQARAKGEGLHARGQTPSLSSSAAALFPSSPSLSSATRAAHSSAVAAAVELLDLHMRLAWPAGSNAVVLMHDGVELGRF